MLIRPNKGEKDGAFMNSFLQNRQSRLILIRLFKLGINDVKKHRSAPQCKTVVHLVKLCSFAKTLVIITEAVYNQSLFCSLLNVLMREFVNASIFIRIQSMSAHTEQVFSAVTNQNTSDWKKKN